MIIAGIEKLVEYREVPGFPNYKVGDDGSVWSNRKWGFRPIEWRKLRCTPGKNGRPIVDLHGESGCKTVIVSRLILEVFVGPCPPGHESCHFPDPNPLNNRVSNLRWGTPKENNGDKKIHGTQPIGERVAGAVITGAMALMLREEYAASHMTAADLARKYGLTRTCVYQVIRGKTHKYAGGPIATGSTRHRQHSPKRYEGAK
jgi:hypothetical protein